MINPITQSKTQIITEKISLFAEDPKQLANFYQFTIGLHLINQGLDCFQLGTHNGKILLEIRQASGRKHEGTTGLYHMAFLLPERKDLGNILNHLIENKVVMEGAADHGYSEAIYLSDLEGNGIEIYVDKAISQWKIDDSGFIEGVVEEMDAEGVLAARDNQFRGLPDGTMMGHVHLHVNDLDKALSFYHEIIGIGLKSIMGGKAIFMASGDYHHHLGMNLWKGKDIPSAIKGDAGLDTVYWKANEEDISIIEAALKEANYPFDMEENSLNIVDPAGINLVIQK